MKDRFIGKVYDENYYVYIFICKSYNGQYYLDSDNFGEDGIRNAIYDNKVESIFNLNNLIKLYELCEDYQDDEKKKEIENILKQLDTLNGREFSSSLSMEANKELVNKYNLTENDLENIQEFFFFFLIDEDKCYSKYVDYEELGRNYAENCYDYDNGLEDYIDFEKLGEDTANNEGFIELDDGSILEVEY